MPKPRLSPLLNRVAPKLQRMFVPKVVCWAVLHDHHDDPPGSALALRFLGAVHRIVLQGQAPQLAAWLSLGGATIAIVTTPGPHFTPLCNNRQQCDANYFIGQCRPMK